MMMTMTTKKNVAFVGDRPKKGKFVRSLHLHRANTALAALRDWKVERRLRARVWSPCRWCALGSVRIKIKKNEQ